MNDKWNIQHDDARRLDKWNDQNPLKFFYLITRKVMKFAQQSVRAFLFARRIKSVSDEGNFFSLSVWVCVVERELEQCALHVTNYIGAIAAFNQ